MRFDVKCIDCKYFRKKAPQIIDCANMLGKAWDPEKQACDNFVQRKP